MDLTVGSIEGKLRKFPKGTSINLSCGCCHHSSGGSENILGVIEHTDYVELNFNGSSQSDVELSKDKEEFYKAEIVKLNKIIESQKNKLERYKGCIESITSSAEWILKITN